MRLAVSFFVFFIATVAIAQAPAYQPVGSMSQLMIDILYPASDAIFYVERAKRPRLGRPAHQRAEPRGIRKPINDAGAGARSGRLDQGFEDARRCGRGRVQSCSKQRS